MESYRTLNQSDFHPTNQAAILSYCMVVYSIVLSERLCLISEGIASSSNNTLANVSVQKPKNAKAFFSRAAVYLMSASLSAKGVQWILGGKKPYGSENVWVRLSMLYHILFPWNITSYNICLLWAKPGLQWCTSKGKRLQKKTHKVLTQRTCAAFCLMVGVEPQTLPQKQTNPTPFSEISEGNWLERRQII